MKHRLLFSVLLCLVQIPYAYGAIQVCNEYAVLDGKSCTGPGDCPDADPNDAGSGACITVTGAEEDICNRWSVNAGMRCFSNDTLCPDITQGDAGQGACGVPTFETGFFNIKIPYRDHPQFGSLGHPVLTRKAIAALTQLPLPFSAESCVDDILNAVEHQTCSDTKWWKCKFPATPGGASATFCDQAIEWDPLEADPATTSSLQNTYTASGASPTVTVGANGQKWQGNVSLATAHRLACDQEVSQQCLAAYIDPTDGPTLIATQPADTTDRIQTDREYNLYDRETSSVMLNVDPDAASTLLMYEFPTVGSRIRKSVEWTAGALTLGATSTCASTTAQINAGPNVPIATCTDAATSIYEGYVQMPDNWDGGTLTFTQTVNDVDSLSQVWGFDYSCQCRGTGTTVNNTFGTPIPANTTMPTANNNVMTTTAAVTCNGTCTGGVGLFWKATCDNAGDNTDDGDARLLSVKMEYAVQYWGQ